MTNDSFGPTTGRYWPFLLFTYQTMIAGSILDNSRGPSYDALIQAFHTGPQVMANIFALSSVASIFSGILAPFWKNSLLGATRTFLALQAAAAIGIATAHLLPGGIFFLFASIFLFGFVNISLVISSTLIITRTVPATLSLRAYTGYHAFYGLASCLAPTIIAFSNSHHWPWQSVFFLAAILNIIVLLQTWFLPPLPPPTLEERKGPPRMQWHHAAVFFGLMLAFYVAAENLVTTRLVYYLQHHLHYPTPLANHYLSAFFIALLFGRLLFALVNFSWRPVNILLVSMSMALTCLLLGMWAHPCFLAIAALALGIFYPCTAILIHARFPQTFANVFATVMFLIYVVNALMHWGAGWLTEYVDIRQAMWTAPAAAILCLICLGQVYREPAAATSRGQAR